MLQRSTSPIEKEKIILLKNGKKWALFNFFSPLILILTPSAPLPNRPVSLTTTFQTRLLFLIKIQ